jgi:hypothetical protein
MVWFGENQMMSVACGSRVTEDVNLTVFQIQYPIFSDACLGIKFILDFAVVFQRRVCHLHYEINLIRTRMILSVI